MKKNNDVNGVLAELAVRDFGTAKVSSSVRGEARRLAKELGCTPLEALPIVMEKINAREARKNEELRLNSERVKGQLKRKKKNKKLNSQTRFFKPGQSKYTVFVQGGAPGLKSQ